MFGVQEIIPGSLTQRWPHAHVETVGAKWVMDPPCTSAAVTLTLFAGRTGTTVSRVMMGSPACEKMVTPMRRRTATHLFRFCWLSRNQ